MERVFWLFPIVFMIHEMEEIIGFRLWFEKNFDLVKKYSTLEKLYSNFSSEGFAIAVLEEYIICIVVTGISIFWEIYIIWIGVFIAFVIHLVIHIIQSLVNFNGAKFNFSSLDNENSNSKNQEIIICKIYSLINTGTVNHKGLLFFLCLKAERRTYGRRKKSNKRITT